MAGGTYVAGCLGVAAVLAALAHGAGAVRRAALPGWVGGRGVLAQAVVALTVGIVVARAAGAVGLLIAPVLLPAEVGAGLLVGWVARCWSARRPSIRRSTSDQGVAVGGPAEEVARADVGAPAELRGSSSTGVRAGIVARTPVPVGAGGWDRPVVGAGPAVVDPAPTAAEAVSAPRRAPWEWALAVGPVAVVVLQWVAHAGDAVGRGMVHPDTLWYHGPFAARMARTGDLGTLDHLGYEAARWFPLDGQLVHALGIVAFGRDWLSPLVNLGWLALALLAAWCIGERVRAGPTALATTSVVLGAPFLAATQPGQMSTDIGCAALLLAAVAIVLESGLRTAPLVVAGCAAGLAIGTKVTLALPALVLVVVVAAVAFTRRGGRPALGWLGAVAVLGGFWFVRDWVLTGSPLPWFTVPGVFDRVTVEGQGASLLAAREVDGATWATVYRPGLRQALGPAWPAVLALVVVGGSVLARWERATLERAAGLVVLAGLLGHVATPLTAGLSFGFNLRYLAPTFLLAAALVPLAVPPGRVGRAVVGGVATVLVAVGATGAHVERVEAWPAATPAAVAVLLVGAGVAAAVVVARRTTSLPGPALAAVVLLLAVVAGGPLEAASEDGRYVDAGLPPTDVVPSALRDVGDARVVVFGTVETYPLFGLDLSNDVEIGTAPPPGPGSSCARWRAHLGHRYDIVVISAWGFVPLPVPPPDVFAGDPAATALARDGAHVVHRLTASLDPTRCPV